MLRPQQEFLLTAQHSMVALSSLASALLHPAYLNYGCQHVLPLQLKASRSCSFAADNRCGTCSLLILIFALHLQLKVKITRQLAAREQKLRRKNLTKYIPNAAAAVFKVLQTMSEVRCTKHFK